MPLGAANARHLLRRTEIVDDPGRVAELQNLEVGPAVDNVMNTPASGSVGTLNLGSSDQDWQRGVDMTADWMRRMRDEVRPFGERMAFFWHGHGCSECNKAGGPYLMRQQIDLFRREGLGGSGQSFTVNSLMKRMAIQGAMLRYLDNWRNFASSPQQNFARELLELFILGVGNYTETEVEAATDAWTGHGFTEDGYSSGTYRFTAERHVKGAIPFFGQNVNTNEQNAGNATIDVVLGPSAVVPAGAANDANRGRPTREVAAEFLTRKLWQEFGNGDPLPSWFWSSGRVGAVMRDTLISTGFQIRPWVRAMLVHADFYLDETKTGLVRQPVEYGVALMSATGLRADQASPTWLMDRTGQRLLFPPNVSGWKPNGYWGNAAAMEARNRMVENCEWRLKEGTWDGDNGYVDLPGGRVVKQHLYFPPGHPGRQEYETDPQGRTGTQLVDRLLTVLRLPAVGQPGGLTTADRTRIAQHLDSIEWWMRFDAFLLILIAPEMHLA